MKPAALVLLAATALAGLGHLVNQPQHEPLVTRAPSPPPVVLGAEPATPHVAQAEEHDEGVAPQTSAEARSTAQRFLMAYLRWETGDDSSPTRRDLRASATPQLTRLLSSGRGQPEERGEISRAKLTSLIAGSVSPDQAATVAAQLIRAGQPSGLAVIVKRSHGRWRVTSIGR